MRSLCATRAGSRARAGLLVRLLLALTNAAEANPVGAIVAVTAIRSDDHATA